MRSNIRTTHRRVLLAGSSLFALAFVSGAADAADLLTPGSLIISTTTYSDTGAVAGLNPGTSLLPGANAGQTVPVVSGGNYVTVWNNAKNDGSFGVTSAINLMSVNGKTGTVNSTLAVPTNQVVTSFSSKSELSLNITNYSGTPNGYNLTFMGYAGAGVGALDVSNSDTPGIPDATNPVTSFFGSNYAFARTIVNVGAGNTISYTPTNAYGGNNGRSAVLGPNGKYYTVGNSNNGASTTPNAITTSTGLEVFNATNSSNAQGTPQNPTQINSNFNSVTGDKFGKDNNYRGLTYYNGNLYFTKGSGSNGIDTVYTVSAPGGGLPTQGNAGTSTISVLPGFPGSGSTLPLAKNNPQTAKNGPDYTPFGLFFANPTTLYVADEGSGDAVDASQHAGLEKWSLENGSWVLDYTLRNGLIGTTYTPTDGTTPWSTVTTAGLRDITGEVNANGTVTIWGVTSTTSKSGDNGADPNEVVEITDTLSYSSLAQGANAETFAVLEAAQYGSVYRGVGYVAPTPLPTAFLSFGTALIGFAGFAWKKSRRKTA
jgi:hypothetical protein